MKAFIHGDINNFVSECRHYFFLHSLLKTAVALFSAHMAHRSDDSNRHFTSQALLDANDGIYDGPEMFKEGSAEVKLCYGMLLQSIASTLGWSGFHSSANSTLLRGKCGCDISALHQVHTCTVCCK
jgi:hypothetical protein